MCLCYVCHDTIHWFRSENQVIRGGGKTDGYPLNYLDQLKSHFIRVNRCTTSQFVTYIKRLHYVRDLRNRNEYDLEYGIYDPGRIIDRYNELRGK